VLDDVCAIFADRRYLIRSVLAVHAFFEEAHDHSGYYFLNKIFIADLAIWIQKVPAQMLHSFTSKLNAARPRVCKTSLGGDFPRLVTAADFLGETQGSETTGDGADI
jgi:hypothetical protein